MFQHNLNFLRDCKISVVEAPAVAGTTTLTTDVLDMIDYDSVLFVALLGDVTDTSVLTLQVLGNDTNDTVSPVTYASAVAAFTAGPTNADNKMLGVDVQKPRDRYVYATLARATANAVLNSIIAIQYNMHDKPNLDAEITAMGFVAFAAVNDPA